MNLHNLSIMMSTKLSRCNFVTLRRSHVSTSHCIPHVLTFSILNTHTHTHANSKHRKKTYLFFISNNWLLSTDLSSSTWKKSTHTKVQFRASPQAYFPCHRSHSQAPRQLKQLASLTSSEWKKSKQSLDHRMYSY